MSKHATATLPRTDVAALAAIAFRRHAPAAMAALRYLAAPWAALAAFARRREQAARMRVELEGLNPRLLKDIGLTRIDILRLQGRQE
jgi:uncharacterized protein YjiS (DUF1127 family)